MLTSKSKKQLCRNSTRRSSISIDSVRCNPNLEKNTISQQHLAIFSTYPELILIAGRYEGIDERVIETEVDEEWSIGDYVLSGGELPAMVLIDAISRRIDGVLGDKQSAEQDSFVSGLLDCPHYTRPEVYRGMAVPDVLLSGNHALIQRWRWQESLRRTLIRRPDLLASATLNAEQRRLLTQIKHELSNDDIGQSN